MRLRAKARRSWTNACFCILAALARPSEEGRARLPPRQGQDCPQMEPTSPTQMLSHAVEQQ